MDYLKLLELEHKATELRLEIAKILYERGQPCKKGEAASRTGCIPANKDKAKPAAKKDDSKPSEPKVAGKSIEDVTLNRAKSQYDKFKQSYLKEHGGSYNDKGDLISVTLNTDDWRGLFPEYKGTNAADVHEASSYLNKQLYAETLESMKGVGNNRMIVLAGGGGSGKGTASRDHLNQTEYPIVLDQVSDNYAKLNQKLNEAKQNGYTPEYVFVDRDPRDAWNGVVGRALSGRRKGGLARTVPLQIALKANIEARKTAIEVLKNNLDMPVSVIDNNRGAGKSVMIKNRQKAISFLESQNHNYEELFKELENETLRLHERGEIPDDIARGLVGDGAISNRRNQLRSTDAVSGRRRDNGQRTGSDPGRTQGKDSRTKDV